MYGVCNVGGPFLPTDCIFINNINDAKTYVKIIKLFVKLIQNLQMLYLKKNCIFQFIF